MGSCYPEPLTPAGWRRLEEPRVLPGHPSQQSSDLFLAKIGAAHFNGGAVSARECSTPMSLIATCSDPVLAVVLPRKEDEYGSPKANKKTRGIMRNASYYASFLRSNNHSVILAVPRPGREP